MLLPLQLRNDTRGHTYGVEAWGTQQLADWWRVSAGGALLYKSFEVRPGALDITAGAALGHDSDGQAMLRSQMALPGGLAFDAGLRAVGAVENPRVKGYVEARRQARLEPDRAHRALCRGRQSSPRQARRKRRFAAHPAYRA
ncbi:MAG: hypothetical protein WDN44_12360 [Sphingomonas sp.]